MSVSLSRSRVCARVDPLDRLKLAATTLSSNRRHYKSLLIYSVLAMKLSTMVKWTEIHACISYAWTAWSSMVDGSCVQACMYHPTKVALKRTLARGLLVSVASMHGGD